MTSLRNNGPVQADPRDVYLDTARACILDLGWRRTTLTEVARRAGVSRMTIYRAWPDMKQLLGDLMTREWGAVVATAVAAEPDAEPVDRLVGGIVETVRTLRDNELFLRIVELDPELLLPYLLSRRSWRSPRSRSGPDRPPAPSATGTRRRSPAPCSSRPTGSCCRRTRWSTTT